MGRTIDADALKDWLEIVPLTGDGGVDINDLVEHIDSMPTASEWVPVSERLPEPRIDVWCDSDMGQMVGYYEENVETWYGRDYLELMVTAWRPLPEPYKGGEQDG